MSPSDKRRAQAELALLLHGRRRRKERKERRRRKIVLAVVVLAICIPAALFAAGFTTAKVFLSSCNLNLSLIHI